MILASAASDLLYALAPFILLIVLWLFILRYTRGRIPPGQAQLLEKLDEIRLELERIRRAVEAK